MIIELGTQSKLAVISDMHLCTYDLKEQEEQTKIILFEVFLMDIMPSTQDVHGPMEEDDDDCGHDLTVHSEHIGPWP